MSRAKDDDYNKDKDKEQEERQDTDKLELKTLGDVELKTFGQELELKTFGDNTKGERQGNQQGQRERNNNASL
jgi:hypothetical protein